LENLGATYDDHLRLIGKRVVDFLLALISAMAEVLRAIIGFRYMGPPPPHQPFFFSEKLG